MMTLMQCAREFTEAAGDEWPTDGPHAMTAAEVDFLIQMCIDELLELSASVYPSDLAKSKMRECISGAKSLPQEDESNVLESQADALVDCVYYIGNAAAKKGINLDNVLLEVHKANMRKVDPNTGKFLRRADGKIMKPANGWVGPNVGEALKRSDESEWGANLLSLFNFVNFFLVIASMYMK